MASFYIYLQRKMQKRAGCEMANLVKAGEKRPLTDVWTEIRKDVESLNYGTVLITVHEGKVVQIETSTKTRFQ